MTDALTDRPATIATQVFTSPTTPMDGGRGTFSPVTSTLFTGPSEAVLVDPQHINTDVDALGDLIEASGKRLTTIYITHGHGDHYLGLQGLLKRFPTARGVALPSVVEYTRAHREVDLQRWHAMFGPRVPRCDVLPEPFEGDLSVDGEPLRVIEIDQADIAPSSIVHEERTGVIVSADLLYNGIHVMLGLTGPAEWDKWLANIDKVEALHPRRIVCGHQTQDADTTDVARVIGETRRYIRTFAEAAPACSDADALIARMTAAFPDWGNPWTLIFSARAYFAAKS